MLVVVISQLETKRVERNKQKGTTARSLPFLSIFKKIDKKG